MLVALNSIYNLRLQSLTYSKKTKQPLCLATSTVGLQDT